MKTLTIEGVPYHRFIVRYRLSDGRSRRLVFRSPGFPWIYEEVGRELEARHGLDGVKPGSCTIRGAA